VIRRERAQGRFAVVAFAAWLALVVAVISACGSSTSKDRDRRATDVDVAVLRVALGTFPGNGARPLVFVSPLDGGRPIPLAVQAAVIRSLEKQADVRFVDEQDEAIDVKTAGKPVLEGGVLFSLAEVPQSGNAIEIRGERYRTAADRSPLRFSVRLTTGGWAAQLIPGRPGR
jgi:hypothetical protein